MWKPTNPPPKQHTYPWIVRCWNIKIELSHCHLEWNWASLHKNVRHLTNIFSSSFFSDIIFFILLTYSIIKILGFMRSCGYTFEFFLGARRGGPKISKLFFHREFCNHIFIVENESAIQMVCYLEVVGWFFPSCFSGFRFLDGQKLGYASKTSFFWSSRLPIYWIDFTAYPFLGPSYQVGWVFAFSPSPPPQWNRVNCYYYKCIKLLILILGVRGFFLAIYA